MMQKFMALWRQSCDDMMQSIAALKSNIIDLMQLDAIDTITKIKTNSTL